jgi:hypothetical protein
MKKIFKYFTLVLISGLVNTACETTELDMRVSPNDLAADQADPNLVLNSIQLAYATNQQVVSDLAAQLTRIDYMFGGIYFNNYPPATLSGVWSRTYSSGGNGVGDPVSVGMFTNINALEDIDAITDVDFSFHIGVGKAMQAHMLIQLVDLIGSAAFSEASNPLEFPAPSLDSGEDVYASALALLDEAEARLQGNPSTQGATDFFYNGNTSQWIRFINTVRLLAYKNTGNTAAFDSVIATGDFIASTEDDFELQYGTSELQPDNRHPDYASDYTVSGANIYQSNWLMNQMLITEDPRIRYYFYRQSSATPGADADPIEDQLSCSVATAPPHFQANPAFIYCSVPNGYWGRTHGNDEGTPPDGIARTAVGVYPAAGLFDDNSFGEVDLGIGGGGAGIEPIILASYVDFWRGQMAASDTERAEFLRAGLTKSIAKVQSFGALDTQADISFAPTEEEVADYIDEMVNSFNNATGVDRENIYAEQYFVSLYGGATDAYNYYRQEGFPTTLFPSWEPLPGPFPRTFLLPENEVINNPNLDQRTDLTTQVFWDTNPASPTFPVAN